MRYKKNHLLFCVLLLGFGFIFAGKKYVIAGGPNSGKSTIIKILQDQGYQTIDETFSSLYLEAKKRNSLQSFFSDQVKLIGIVIKKQIERENAIDPEKDVFLDRSVYDAFFHGCYLNLNMPIEISEMVKNRSYSIVFYLDSLPALFFEQTEIRRETREEALRIHLFFEQQYKKIGIPLVHVPFDTPENRARFILNVIYSNGQ